MRGYDAWKTDPPYENLDHKEFCANCARWSYVSALDAALKHFEATDANPADEQCCPRCLQPWSK